MAEGQVLQNPIGVSFIHQCGATETAATFGVFALKQVAFASTRAQDFAGAGNFETFGHRFFCFDTFGSSHIQLSLKKSAQYRVVFFRKQVAI